KDDLTSEVCHVVLTKLAYLAGSGQEDALKAVGMSDKEIARLERLSLSELGGLLDVRNHPVDIQSWVSSLLLELKEDIPEEYHDYLKYGANNKMMFRLFKVSAAQCSAWRDKLFIDKPYRARSISDKQ
ncbi:STY4526/YPO1902 family pathogenicity island replication protein, partial [uncultured Vibrio sp.]|uniref:STY4526/YPO1902 family pathogenicity island replication protein n=1 Tax=uncultured Vibrio sp. TaxID=114054 RepID=UPI00262C5F87